MEMSETQKQIGRNVNFNKQNKLIKKLKVWVTILLIWDVQENDKVTFSPVCCFTLTMHCIEASACECHWHGVTLLSPHRSCLPSMCSSHTWQLVTFVIFIFLSWSFSTLGGAFPPSCCCFSFLAFRSKFLNYIGVFVKKYGGL